MEAFREKREVELLAEAKATRVGAIARHKIDDFVPLFIPDVDRDELALLVASHFPKPCEARKVSTEPCLRAVVKIRRKALAKKAIVEAAATEAGVEAAS